jgi:hypothetical protein
LRARSSADDEVIVVFAMRPKISRSIRPSQTE